MKHARNVHIAAFLASLLFFFASTPALSQGPFQEDDWIAWGDARNTNDISIGLQYIYVATSAGIYRYDRYQQVWLTPWFSVPLPGNESILLGNVLRVREDPVTRDLYALTEKGWLRRTQTAGYWEKVDQPDKVVGERLLRGGKSARPAASLIAPLPFQINPDGSLRNLYKSWKFSVGLEDELGPVVYGWKGFGFGARDLYSARVDLFPAGPGRSTGMDLTQSDIWCAGRLDRQNGWVWHRDRSSNAWEFFDPDNVFGLEPGDVLSLKIGPDNIVWMATTAGVMYFQENSWSRLRKVDGLPNENVQDVAPFEGGAWIATGNGLGRITLAPKPAVYRPSPDLEPLVTGYAYSAVAMDSTTLYATGGGVLFRKKGKQPFEQIDPPSVGSCTALFARDGKLALGGTSGFAWDAGGSDWGVIGTVSEVYAIEFEGGFWWLGTDDGLIKFDPKTRKQIRFGEREGLPGRQVFSVHAEGDWLWLGTDLALVRFYWNSSRRSE